MLEEHKPLRGYAAMTTEVIVTVGFLLAHTEIGVFLGAPLAVIVYFAVSRLQRRRVIARMAPRLAATTGEDLRDRIGRIQRSVNQLACTDPAASATHLQ